MDPQQELFTMLLTGARELYPDSVFDGAYPDADTQYPFIHIAEGWQVDDANKGAVFGEVTQVIHVWHEDPSKRGTLSSMMLALKQKAMGIEHGRNFSWDYRNASQQIMQDNTTKQALLHGVLTLHFYFN